MSELQIPTKSDAIASFWDKMECERLEFKSAQTPILSIAATKKLTAKKRSANLKL